MNFLVNGKTTAAGTGGVIFESHKPTVVFLHGAGMDHTVWALQTRYMAHHGFSVLALDLPGHGRSDGPGVNSIEKMADWVLSAVSKLTDKPVILVGHSMGAIISIEIAATHSSIISGLVLVGVALPMTVNKDLLVLTQNQPEKAINLITSWAYGFKAQIGGTRTPGLWMMSGGQRLLQRSRGDQLYRDFDSCNNYKSGSKSASNITCPTLIIAGESDKMTPIQSARKAHDLITNSELEIIKGAGHMIMIESPDKTLDILTNFLSSKGLSHNK